MREEVARWRVRECVRASAGCPGPRRRHRLRREGKASRGAGWRLDRASVTSRGSQGGASPCRLLACQEERQGGAQGWEWKRSTAWASPAGCAQDGGAGLVCGHTRNGGRSPQTGGGASACLPLAQGLPSTRVSVPKGLEGLLLNVLLFQVGLWNEDRYKGSLIKISSSQVWTAHISNISQPLPPPPTLFKSGFALHYLRDPAVC